MTERVCDNPECLSQFIPNVRGADSRHCSRCYRYATRHNGVLPGPKEERVPTTRLTVVLPADFPGRVTKVSRLPLATWVRYAAESILDRLERIEKK